MIRSKQAWAKLPALGLILASLACSLAPPPSLVPARPTSTVLPSPTSPPAISPTAAPAEEPNGLEEIQGQVSTVRGLYPSRPLDLELLSPEALGARIEDDFLAEYTPEVAADDARLLALLGLVEPSFDLLEFHQSFYEEQVAGYYDTEVEKMYVVGAQWGGAERLTYAHEYVHALQDQAFDLEDGLGYNDEACQEDPERCAAVSALIEGDATLAEEQWWQAFSTPEDFDDLMEAIEAYRGEVFDAAPDYIRQDFLFPYEQGLSFVRALFRQGGWAAVDAAYLDPPTTTEEILHPELYGEEETLAVELPDLVETLGDGWRELEPGVLGEWFTYLVLDQEIPDWQAEQAAAGWGGDAYRAYVNGTGDEAALVLLTRWDSARHANEFIEAFHEYGGWRFGERQPEASGRWTWQRGAVLLERGHDQTLWIVAPDAATAAALREGVEFPAR